MVVIFGVHWGITPVVLANFDMQGFDTFQAFQTIAVVAQVAAAFGVFIRSKTEKSKVFRYQQESQVFSELQSQQSMG